MTREHVFQIGSMTKQFTAIAGLMLAEQGKLSIGDAVSNYVPDYPVGGRITIHHLLTHTTGIKDFIKMKALSKIAQKPMTPQTKPVAFDLWLLHTRPLKAALPSATSLI